MIVLNSVAHVPDDLLKQLKSLFEFADEDFLPTVEIGETPRAMPAEVQYTSLLS